MKKLKVLHVAETVKGGIATCIDNLNQMESKSFHLIVPSKQVKELSSKYDSLNAFQGAGRASRAIALLCKLLSMKSRIYNYDVVHIHSTGAALMTLIASKYWGEDRRPKLVYSSHGWSGLRDLPSFKKRISKFLDRVISKNVDYIIDISKNEARYSSEELGVQQGDRCVIYNGIDTSSIVRKYGNLNDRIKIAFVGRFDLQKGYDILQTAIKQTENSDLEFEIVGDYVVDGGKDSRLHSVNVKYHGWLPRCQLLSVLSECDYLVMPSRWEGFGLVAVEAMSLGVPVLCSDRGALPEVVGSAGKIFSIDNECSLVELLSSLSKPTQIDRDAAFAQSKLFTVGTMIRKTREAYEKSIKES